MDARKLRRSFVFSNEDHKRLIETLLLRSAEEDNTNVSAIIETALIDYLVVRYAGSYPADKLVELRSNKKE